MFVIVLIVVVTADTLQGQKYVYIIVAAITASILLDSGFPPDFGIWMQGFAHIQPQQHYVAVL